MTEIKLPPMPEPDHYAFLDGGQGIWVEGGPTGTPFYSEQQVRELMREAVRLNAKAVPDIDYEALIAAAYKRDRKWAQGTNGCIAFARGAEWFREQCLSAAPAAPQPAQPLTDDPCPGCQVGKVCRTPKCGRLKLPVDHPLRTGVKHMSIEAMKKALEALENHSGNYKLSKAECAIHNSVVEQLSTAIAAAEKAEPVWVQPDHLEKARLAPFLCRVEPQQRDDFVSCYPLPPDTAAMLAEKDALFRQALEALEGFIHITNDSQGVAGYHLSGDTAEWGEFPEVYHADKAIEAIRNHLGVKND